MTRLGYQLPSDLEKRLHARADELGVEPDELLGSVVNTGLDSYTADWGESGSRLAEAASGPGVFGVYFPAEPDEDGEADVDLLQQQRAELEALLRKQGLEVDVVARSFEVGIGAQGDPWTLLQICAAVAAVSGAVAAPALTIEAWAKAIPILRGWLQRRSGPKAATLDFVKECCMEDARSRVEHPGEIVSNLVAGHRGTAVTTAMDIEAVGPYCVTIQVPQRSKTFVYITDELGQILHFAEVAGPTEEQIVVEDNAPGRGLR